MDCQEIIHEVEELTTLFLQKNDSIFKKLTENQLHWKPSPKKWSVHECIEHINYTSHHYLKEIRKSIEKNQGKKGYEWTDIYKPGYLGQKSALQMKPKNGMIKNKMGTFSSINPLKNPSKTPALEEFDRLEKEWLEIFDLCREVNMNKVKVTTLLPILRFRLGDVLRFVTYHAERHILQAENVIQEMNHS